MGEIRDAGDEHVGLQQRMRSGHPVEWGDDDVQAGDWFTERLREELAAQPAPVVELIGTWGEREERAIAAVRTHALG